jgi:hypothetical protein
MTETDPIVNYDELKERVRADGGIIIELDDGYWGIIGLGPVAYIVLPAGHPDIMKSHHDLDPEVNGGLTYSRGRIFGWDYMHAYNDSTPEDDLRNALKYFKARG